MCHTTGFYLVVTTMKFPRNFSNKKKIKVVETINNLKQCLQSHKESGIITHSLVPYHAATARRMLSFLFNKDKCSWWKLPIIFGAYRMISLTDKTRSSHNADILFSMQINLIFLKSLFSLHLYPWVFFSRTNENLTGTISFYWNKSRGA